MSEDPDIQRDLALLDEIAQIGMALLREGKDYAATSRAVRLTLAQKAKLRQEQREVEAGLADAREADEEKAAESARVAKETAAARNKSNIRRLVLAVAESESERQEDYLETWDRLEDHLDRDGRFRDIGEWKTRYAVERLCEALNLHPDWTQWTGDGWSELRHPQPRWTRTSQANGSLRPQLE